MSVVTRASAYANNAVAYIAWQAPRLGETPCVGFEITRLDGSGAERVLAAWVPFEGQNNPDWKPQTTSVWPVQKFTWRDLTVRQFRDQVALHDQGTYRYRVRPLVPRGQGGPGAQPVSVQKHDGDYDGPAFPLDYLDEGMTTAPVSVTSTYGPVQVAFNNGILSTQWLTHALGAQQDEPGALLVMLKKAIVDEKNPVRRYLAGDVPQLFRDMFDRLQHGGTLYLALYELTDQMLVDLIVANARNVHLILSNTSQDKNSKLWDQENQPNRKKLHALNPPLAQMYDRLFNNDQHIGHNKFAVYVDANGAPQAVLSGSTNWTPNGLCAQSNNAFVADVPELARQYLGYWQDLRRDTESFAQPAEDGAQTNNAQGADLRSANHAGLNAVPLGPTPERDGAIRLWRSPNTPQKTKPAKSPALPVDLNEVFWYLQHAKKAVFFAVFLPSGKGENSVVSACIQAAAANPDLTIYGVISSAMAMPTKPGAAGGANPGDGTQDDGSSKVWNDPVYEDGNVHILRADALTVNDAVGDFQQELLSAGNAIVHDKIVVVDPLDPTGCVAVTGSHNLGFKASYANDDNIAIVRNHPGIAKAYMVHVLDLYEHYRFRAVQDERTHGGQDTSKQWSGFLHTDADWQKKYPDGLSDLSAYLA
jgi:phosphatidylserine/phosphatidylglycerophosphate/cardiolipin synthase-like enzyme